MIMRNVRDSAPRRSGLWLTTCLALSASASCSSDSKSSTQAQQAPAGTTGAAANGGAGASGKGAVSGAGNTAPAASATSGSGAKAAAAGGSTGSGGAKTAGTSGAAVGGSGGGPAGAGGTAGAADNTGDAGVEDVAGSGGSGAAGGGAPTAVKKLCSGCPSEMRDIMDLGVQVHHVHLNVKDVRAAVDFYAKFFGTEEVQLNDSKTAIWAEPILFLLDVVDHELSDTLEMGFEHAGIGVDDVAKWFEERSPQGLMADTRNDAPATPQSLAVTPGDTPFFDPDVNEFAYIYVRGPAQERIECWSGLKKFRHLHFYTPNVDETISWYTKLTGVDPLLPSAAQNLGIANAIRFGNDVQAYFTSVPSFPKYVATDDKPVGHFGLSVTSLDRVMAKVTELGLQVVKPPAQTDYGFRSFFVRGPQEVLVEFVEAAPLKL